MNRYRLQTGGKWLVKGGEQIIIGQMHFYKGSEINGWYSPSHRITVKDTKTGEEKSYFPGEKIVAIVERKKKKTNGKAKTSKPE